MTTERTGPWFLPNAPLQPFLTVKRTVLWVEPSSDEDGVGGHDAADALRYLVAAGSRTVAQPKLRGL